MTIYKLHYFPETGNSNKLALILALCGQAFEPVWTDFGGAHSKGLSLLISRAKKSPRRHDRGRKSTTNRPDFCSGHGNPV